jgi:hypothetical protein
MSNIFKHHTSEIAKYINAWTVKKYPTTVISITYEGLLVICHTVTMIYGAPRVSRVHSFPGAEATGRSETIADSHCRFAGRTRSEDATVGSGA